LHKILKPLNFIFWNLALIKRLFLAMKHCLIFALTLILSLDLTAQQATATGKNALVVGNSAYKDSPLKNAENDAHLISTTLRELGFTVIEVVNANKETMSKAIRDFGQLLANSPGVGLFYYAGHGLQSNGANYIVPINAKVEEEFEIEFECVKADRALSVMEYYKNPFNIIILDACRNNPFRGFSRSADNGLATPSNPPTGSIIAFATQPGKTASDGVGKNGLYTEELVKAMKIPNLPIEEAFKKVRINVAKASGQSQVPQEWSSLMGDFSFIKEEKIEQTVEQKIDLKESQETTAGLKEVAKPKMQIGQSQYLTGNLELKVLFTGDLFIDSELQVKVQQGTVLPINNISIGNHELKIVGVGHTWTESVSISANETTRISSSLPTIKANAPQVENSVKSNTTSTTRTQNADDLDLINPSTKSRAEEVDTEKIYDYLAEKAEPRGDIKAFYDWIAQNIEVPSEARKNNVKGMTIASFVIMKDGSISDVKITKSLGFGWDQELVRTLTKTKGLWKPGKLNGVKVNQRVTVPFVLSYE
jgi:Caspase domain/Gram-negative bacterial TonB protein C-terminal